MSNTHLAVVESAPRTDLIVEPLSQRVRRLQVEARTLAKDHVEMLREALAEVSRLSADISEGGDAYPVGAREVARRLAEDAKFQSLTLGAITERRPSA
ncbi:MAG TPA: hypothetical protein VII73_12000 [Caulobacteraceae bacterium]